MHVIDEDETAASGCGASGAHGPQVRMTAAAHMRLRARLPGRMWFGAIISPPRSKWGMSSSY